MTGATVPRLLVLASAAALPVLGLFAAPASAGPNPACTVTAHRTTCVFSYPASAIHWQLPYGVTSMTVVADGAAGGPAGGGTATGGAGGLGGEYRAQISGLPVIGEHLTVTTGGAGAFVTGGSNGGGAGTTDTATNTSGGGGGASFVKDASSTILVVAGGGGGAGAEKQTASASAAGGNGGGSSAISGLPGTGSPAAGGGATVSTGGTAGTNTSCTTAATAGIFQQGGASATTSCAFAGGGGGGGYFGGGGAGNGSTGAGGGGGGSAYPATTSTIDGFQVTPEADSSTEPGNGQVTISFRNVRTTLSPSLSFNAGQTDTLHATLTAGPHGHPVAGEPVDFSTGSTPLCTGVLTNSRGHARCVLTAAETLQVELNGGQFEVSFAGGVGLTPAHAVGVSSWFPWS